jgi:4-amino-4-deoxy-L-arabinose transferase-like glycosyltransferase
VDRAGPPRAARPIPGYRGWVIETAQTNSPPRRADGPPERPPLAWLSVAGVALAVVGVLLAAAPSYGYHRDELYFRILADNPAWGYVDQPPLTPMLVKLAIAVLGDTVWALRAPAAILVGVCAVLAALIAREVGGGRGAQTLAAAGGVSAAPLIFGHAMLTATPDLVVWLLVILLAMRALLRDRPRLWLAVGVVVGIGLYNKHLVILLLVGLAAGLLLVGPRRVLVSGWLWAGVAVALVVGAPNLIYQATSGFPQLEMAAALAEDKGDEARTLFVPMQLILLGVPLVPIWIAGLATLLRDRELRPVRALALAYPVICLLLLVIAGQPYYTTGLLLAFYAIGSAPTARWAARGGWRRVLVGAAVVINAAVSAVVALPIVPLASLGQTPIPEINQVARDQVGWPTYTRQVADVVDTLPPDERVRAVIITANYGEAGALMRYGPEHDLPPVFSGQNELYHLARPPESAEVVIIVGTGGAIVRDGSFTDCAVVGRLDNEVGVDNEEQGLPVWVCRGRTAPWSQLWPRVQHFS